MKLSEKFWSDKEDPNGALPWQHCSDYDEILSLEANIGMLELFRNNYVDGERFLGFLEDHESTLQQLKEKHGL